MPNILPLITFPDPILKQKSKPVEIVDDKLRKFMDQMLETMYESDGLGLAAVQVGVLKRILVMDVNDTNNRYPNANSEQKNSENSEPFFIINPKIIKKSTKTSVFKEGCLSFPELRADVTRPEAVTVEFLDYHGKKQIIDFTDLEATCVQHEIDHLNGVTFVDHLSKIKRQMLLKKLLKRNKN